MMICGPMLRFGISYDLFLEQGREFQKNYDAKKLDKFLGRYHQRGPHTSVPDLARFEIIKWVESGEYAEVMKINRIESFP
jgi:hypothetical protein